MKTNCIICKCEVENWDIAYPENEAHSTPEYVEWMANVWRLNDERNKLIEHTEKAKSARAKHSRGVNPRVTELRGNKKLDVDI